MSKDEVNAMYLTHLPNELLQLILRNNDCRDIVNFGSTCKDFNNLIKNNEYLWKVKLEELIPKCMFDIVSTSSCKGNWFHEVKFFYKMKNNIYSEIITMSPKYHCIDDEAMMHDVKNVFEIALTNNLSFYYTIYILQDLIRKGHQFLNKKMCIIPYTLTEMYYAKVVLKYLMYAFLTVKWIQMHMKGQLKPEVVLCLFTQWMDVVKIHSDEDIKVKISDIVKEVEALLIKNSPATSMSELKLHEKVAQKLISKKKVLEAITEIIYHQRGMTVTQSVSLETFDIDQVLTKKCGNIMAVAIIYYFVARECGVSCNVINFPNHFFLKWRDNSNEDNPQSYTLDINTGEWRQHVNCPYSGLLIEYCNYCPNSLLLCIVKAFDKILEADYKRTVNNALMLLCLEDEPPYDNLYYAYRSYLQNDISLTDIATIDLKYIQDEYLQILSTLSRSLSSHTHRAVERVIKERDSQVKYAIGMVCSHRTYEYNCVIVGWDLACNEVWLAHPVSKGLQLGINQPFYTVFSEDQTKRYVAQENLIYKKNPSRFDHIEDRISRYFTHFNGFAYVPNKEKQEQYPYDMHISNMYRDRVENKTGIEF